jgi:hypothetical protein
MDMIADPAGARAVTSPDVAHAEVLLQLCGEILLSELPARQPVMMRATAAIGLELLDLLLNPDHVLRATEDLTLRNTLVLCRRVRLDISLDRLSRHQEEGAAELSALVSQRAGREHRAPAVESSGTAEISASDVGSWDLATPDHRRLWIPLDLVPRPLAVTVAVTGTDGSTLPRPPQHELLQALEAALYHILRESLRAHPDFAEANKPVNALMRHDDRARWLLQRSLLSVCQFGPGTPRYDERIQEVRSLLGQPGRDDPSGEALLALLDDFAAGGHALAASRRVALLVLRDALSRDEPFLELLRLVHRHYFLVAGLDRSVRDHSVEFDLPECEAADGSVIRNLFQRSRRTFDPREHNYTVRIRLPLPENLRVYNLQVRAASDPRAPSYNEVSLIGAIHYDDHPARSALDALVTCAEELMAGLHPPTNPAAVSTASGPTSRPDAQAMSIGFIASRAAAALDRLRAITDAQHHAAEVLEARWGRASTWTVKQLAGRLRAVTTEARQQLDSTRGQLELMTACLLDTTTTSLPSEVAPTPDALLAAVRVMEHPLLACELVSNELAGQEAARIRIDRSTLASRSAPHPRTIEVWTTITDEARPYAYSAIGPPVGLAVFLYFTGSLLFDTLVWPLHVGHLLPATILSGEADAIVAVLLLAPALAATQFTVPDRWSVAGRLRRPARLFVLVAIGTLGGTAMVVATQVGGASADAAGHPHLVVWAFRSALGVLVAWSLWASLAATVRRRYAWRPKGLRSLFAAETVGERPGTTRRRRLRSRTSRRWALLGRRRLFPPGRFFDYDNKAPDADFEMTTPTRSFPSHPGVG